MSRGRASLAGVPIGEGVPVVVMGVLNVSPESFHARSVHVAREALLRAALGMAEAGAALVDVGARSTAPYRQTAIEEAEEARRLGAAIEWLAAKIPVPLSADTARLGPARAAVAAGARVINDVSGLRDPGVAALVAERRLGVVLTATPPTPAGVAAEPVAAVGSLLRAALARATAAGIEEDQVVVDPGIGFFRDEPVAPEAWDLAVLARLPALRDLGRPLCVGLSRKSFVGAVTGRVRTDDRLAGSLAATAIAVLHGAALVRTHDVPETLDAIRIAEPVARATMTRAIRRETRRS